MSCKITEQLTHKYKKIPCPNCSNKLIAVVYGVNDGIEKYKCQVCKAIITYDHKNSTVIDIERKNKFDREVGKTQITEKL